MSQLLSLGAINKLTGEYVYPRIANKKDEYICPECNKDLILVQGEIRVHHFRHKTDNVTPCNHYSNPTETQIHKDAKLLLKTLLEQKASISFIRSCASCNKKDEFEIPEISETSSIKIEYRFDHDGVKIADVAYIDNGDIVCIFEICNTHKTRSESRPEPWFEIDAKTLINIANNIQVGSIQLPCIRCEKCYDCIENTKMQLLKHSDIDKYIRIKLGQTIFPTPTRKDCKSKKRLCDESTYEIECSWCRRCHYNNYGEYCDKCKPNDFCDECKYNEWYDKVWKKEGHLRIDYDAQEDFAHNKKIIKLFEEDFVDNNVVIHTWKGGVHLFIVSKVNYKRYDYWQEKTETYTFKGKQRTRNFSWQCINFPPYIKKIQLEGNASGAYGTVEIIRECIRYSNNINI
jgi:hypothetical protein